MARYRSASASRFRSVATSSAKSFMTGPSWQPGECTASPRAHPDVCRPPALGFAAPRLGRRHRPVVTGRSRRSGRVLLDLVGSGGLATGPASRPRGPVAVAALELLAAAAVAGGVGAQLLAVVLDHRA